MDQNDETKAIHDILMCVIGEALMTADASFMFGYDFSHIINKYAPLLKRANVNDAYVHEALDSLRNTIRAVNDTQPFQGDVHAYLQEKIDNVEREIYG